MAGVKSETAAPELAPEPSTRPASPAPYQTGHKPCLTLLYGGEVGQCHWLDEKGVLIGRSRSATLTFEDDTISRQHAQIVFDGNAYSLKDLGSRNGTYLNGERVISAEVLGDGDKLLIGANLLLRFNLADPADVRFQEQLRAGVARDLLTGAFNARHFEEQLGAERAYAHRHGEPLSMLVVRPDALAAVTQELGAGAAAQVLVHLARLLTELLRKEDVLARMADDTFCVLLRGVALSGAYALGERLRKQAPHVVVPGASTRMTASVAAVDASPTHAETPEALWQEARGLVAESRSRGGNCVLTAAEQRTP